MFLDLRDWEKAKEIVETVGAAGPAESGVSMLDLLKRQAQWLLEVNDMKAAAEMYWAAMEYELLSLRKTSLGLVLSFFLFIGTRQRSRLSAITSGWTC